MKFRRHFLALLAAVCLAPDVASFSPVRIRTLSPRKPHSVKKIGIREPSIESPLFRRPIAATIADKHGVQLQQRRPLAIRKRRLPSTSLSLITALLHCTRPALALSLHPTLSKPKRLLKTALKALALWLIITSTVQQIRVKRRQSLDATSEWGRYAAHPGARGRAVLSLSLQILPFWLAGLVYRTKAARHYLRTRSGKLFANGLLQLGPLYIKLGQIVSCRENLLPEEWKVALERLQDKVPARSGQDALDLAYASIGSKEEFDRIFSNFTTTPLAAASLGQVHKAVLRSNNDTVAVKVQRPYLREIYDRDFALLIRIASIMDRFFASRAKVGGVQQSWTDIFTDAKDILYREIDYRDEADNAIRFAQDFGLGKGGRAVPGKALTRTNDTIPSAAMWLRTPYVYRNVSSEKVLVMEFVPSIKITDSEKLDAANLTAEEREYLADNLARSYLRQFCVNKFFSTDPHPGNLGVERINGRPRLVFYDFGQACELNSDQADGILAVIEAIVDSDADRCVDAFQTMGVLTDDVDVDKVRAKVQDNFEKGLVKVRKNKLKKAGYAFQEPRKNNGTTTVMNVTKDEKDSDVMKYFTLPAEYAFVARAISQMDGVGKSLDPYFDFISSAAPNIVEIKGAGEYLKDEFNKFVENFQQRLTDTWKKIVNGTEYKDNVTGHKKKNETVVSTS